MTNKSWFPTWDERNRVEHFRRFKTQVASLFEDWFGRSMGGVLAPRVDVAEDEKSMTLTAELPGANEKDIDVSLVGDQLTIKGEKRSEHEDKKETDGHVVHRLERSYGAFQRTITVQYQVDPNQVSADFKDGVLRITLPKPADAVAQKQGQKIEVNKASRVFGGGTYPNLREPAFG
jgi:HSP20 family protein